MGPSLGTAGGQAQGAFLAIARSFAHPMREHVFSLLTESLLLSENCDSQVASYVLLEPAAPRLAIPSLRGELDALARPGKLVVSGKRVQICMWRRGDEFCRI